MILLVVFAAHVVIFLCEYYIDVPLYYVVCSLAYSGIAIASALVWLSARSRIILAYAGVNFLAAVFNFFISDGVGYDTYADFYFGVFQYGASVIEVLTLIQGGASVIIAIRSRVVCAKRRGVRGHSVLVE